MGQEEAEDAATAERRAMRDPAWQAAFDVDGEFTDEQKKEAVRVILLDYAWLPRDTAEQKAANVACIMAQDGWQYVQARADQFAGAQFEPGPAALSPGPAGFGAVSDGSGSISVPTRVPGAVAKP